MENRLTALSRNTDESEKTLLVPYMVAGYPTLERSREAFELFAEEGADIIEIGIPFSDPLADGVVIQEASNRSLKNGTDLDDVFSLVKSLRKVHGLPLLLMGYTNPIYKRGISKFFSECAEAGVDGVIIPDLSPQESEEYVKSARDNNISTIFLVAPNTTEERIKFVGSLSTEFIYCVSVFGVTGQQNKLPEDLQDYLERVKRLSGRKILVGFGVNSKESALKLAPHSDGIVIGSAFVKLLKPNDVNSINELRSFFRDIRQSLRKRDK
ncbi:MAG: tryptophan synthase subunit alpha [Candidatus Marinimicrobia bacterium]|nr:tryptophan synthase subunit alpha [Candidatus Neomarinimicrobiota bacterium]